MRPKSKTWAWRGAIALILILFAVLSSEVQGQTHLRHNPRGAVLNLSDYLEMIRARHGGYAAAQSSGEASELYERESEILTTPTFFVNTQYSSDAKPSSDPRFRYDKILSTSSQIGIGQQTDFGLLGKFAYGYNETELKGLTPKSYEARPSLELTQSLWRNFFGREIKAQKSFSNNQVRAARYNSMARLRGILIEAETIYWRLALSRDLVQVQKDSVDRAQKIYDLAAKKVRLSLADRSDELQAAANLKARQLDLRVAQDEEIAASLAFNRARSIDSEQVPQALEPLHSEALRNLQIPARAEARADVLAALMQSQAAKAASIVNIEKNRPTLELFGAYALNGQGASSTQAIDQAWTNDRPTQTVGIRLSAPLDFSLLQRNAQGYRKEADAAQLSYERKAFEQERDWHELVQKFHQARERLVLAEDLERLQAAKFNYERDRQSRGRSTVLQVLTFEADYEAAQFGRLRTVNEILSLLAQMKMYGVDYESR